MARESKSALPGASVHAIVRRKSPVDVVAAVVSTWTRINVCFEHGTISLFGVAKHQRYPGNPSPETVRPIDA